MRIGIDASRAFLKNRTGIEEYSYRVMDGLKNNLQNEQVVLYVRKTDNLQLVVDNGNTKINELKLPASWSVKVIKWPRFWTQLGLSLELFLHPIDCLFVPAHTVPIFHPKKTVVVVHGLEYEFCPKAYSLLARQYMRATIRKSCQWASEIISVSENTKKDLMKLYNVPAEKIEVIYEGYEKNSKLQIPNFKQISNDQISKTPCHSGLDPESGVAYESDEILKQVQDDKRPYLLFIGRIEQRKNIENIIKSFEILKEQYKIPHKLILAGKPGFGYGEIKSQMADVNCANDIIELGYVGEDEKWELLKKADVFVFPTIYEGFGIPVLEAQSVGTAVVASNNSSIPEVALDSAILVDPRNAEEIADSIYSLISDENLKNAIIEKGLENVKRFSWEKCSKEIAAVLERKN